MENTNKYRISGFKPIFSKNSKILILGTLPGNKSDDKGKYYSHPKNNFWYIIAELTKQKIDIINTKNNYELIKNNYIAIWDVLHSAVRVKTSSDNKIDYSKEPIFNDIVKFIGNNCPNVKTVVFNGRSAWKAFNRLSNPYRSTLKDAKVEIKVLTSTSPAAHCNKTKLFDEWISFLKERIK